MNQFTGGYATISLNRPVSMPSALAARSKWSKEVDDAGIVWSRLTENDLRRLQDHQATLANLVHDRYGISYDEADRQVMTFIQDHQTFSL